MLFLYRLIDEYCNPGYERDQLLFILVDALIWLYFLMTSIWYWPISLITFFNLIYLSAKVLIIRREFNRGRHLINSQLKLFLDDLTLNLEKFMVLIELGILLVVIILIVSNQFRKLIPTSYQISQGDQSYLYLWVLDYQLFLIYILLGQMLL